MVTSNLRPKWWQIYPTLPLLIALFVVESRLKISSRGHQAVQIGIVLLVYGFLYIWLKANARAFSGMDQEQAYARNWIIRVPPAQLTESKNEGIPMFQLSDSEIKGMLSDTFEMDYIDEVAFSVAEVPQESKKE